MRKFTWILTLVGAAICLFHFLGFDPHNIVLFSLSVPAWFIPFFTRISNVDLSLVYVLTIASWAFIGYIIDRIIARRRAE
jgi:hypothetical protein